MVVRRMILGATVACALSLGGCAGGPHRAEVNHPNGKVAQTGLVVDGMQEGEWTHYYANGARMAQGNYLHDVRDGLWTHWYEDGTVKMRGRYAGERQVGPWEFFHPNGALQCRGEFRDGREIGEWVFGHLSGAEQQRGWFLDGHRELQWQETSPEGKTCSIGSYLDDQPAGRWRRFAADGTETVLEYPMPDGVEHVLEMWDDGSLRREGWLRGGKPDGLWVTHHHSGRTRAVASFRAGEPYGAFSTYCTDGTALASVALTNGRPGTSWIVRGTPASDTSMQPPRMPWDRQWSDDALAEQQPPRTVAERWFEELCSPRTPAPRAIPAAVAEPASSTAPPRLEAPTDPGAWTVREREELATYRRYLVDGWLPRRQSLAERYGGSTDSRRLGAGDARLANALLGKPLPVTRFLTADGGEVDLNNLHGKKVLLVVLRGFTSQLCPYCFAQTSELAPCQSQWTQLDCEVVVLFPGSRSRLEAFAAAYARDYAGELPPFRIVYDADLNLARALGLQGNLARPASLVLDREGVIRYAYVAENETNVADRPPISELLAFVGQLH